MYKLFSWYNQNRRKFWTIVLAIFVIALIIWRLMYITMGNNQTTPSNQNLNISENTFNSVSVESTKSAITGENLTTNSKNQVTVIDEFVSYCNSGKIQEAYNLLSNECKEEMYPNIKIFQEAYYQPVFGSGKKNASIENWIGDIYKVDFGEDYLATGKYTKDGTLQDYITIATDSDGKSKLNINKYIRRTTMDKSSSFGDVNVKIIKRDTYMNYEIYTFEITNNSDNTIALGDIQNMDASYLEDENGLKYNAYVTELAQPEIVFTPHSTKTVRIKYFNQYSSTRIIKSLVFPNVILDYERYTIFDDKKYYNRGYTQIKFDL